MSLLYFVTRMSGNELVVPACFDADINLFAPEDHNGASDDIPDLPNTKVCI